MKTAKEMLEFTNSSRLSELKSYMEREALKGQTYYVAEYPYNRGVVMDHKDLLESNGYKVEVKETRTIVRWA